MFHAVIMAGGSGTRFWPASRKSYPKQLLPLAGERTMIQATVDRLGTLVPPDRRWIVTNQSLVAEIQRQLPEMPSQHIIGEPCRRDTAPCIGLAAALIQHVDPEGIMAVMPSDHVIASPEQFQAALVAGQRLIESDPDRIVTYGIPPTYPAESFGYIERGAAIAGQSAFDVRRFREKPDRATAQQYLESGDFYWNSGIFLWRAATILAALKANVPKLHAHLQRIADAIGRADYDATLQREFTAIEGTSIDYAVMEKYPQVAVIEAPFAWDDVGSWQSIARLHEPDQDDNAVIGSHVGIDTTGAIIHARPGHTIVTIDVHDLIVVQTADATLVAPKHAEERVREAVAALADRGLQGLL
jgi:mannose-1-phosphate guanylyltransferase